MTKFQLSAMLRPTSGALLVLCTATGAFAQGRVLLEPLGAAATPEDGAGPALALGDLNGDGLLDVLRAGWEGARALHFGRGDGTFEPSLAPLPATTTGLEIRLGDVDGDGDLDAFLSMDPRFPSGHLRLWLNDGAGGFTDVSPQLPPAVAGTRCTVLADLDGDGDLDLFGGYHDWANRLWLGDGAGGFIDASALLPPNLGEVVNAGAADVDGDGDLDLLVGRQDSNFGTGGTPCDSWVHGLQPLLLRNDGTAGFVDASAQLPQVAVATRAVALGDVDGDGDVDALLGNDHQTTAAQRQTRLWLNDGTGTFTDATAQLPQDGEGTASLALVDLDADGDLDLVRGGAFVWYCYPGNGSRTRLWRNDGTGRFNDASLPEYTESDDTVVAAGDVDGDSDVDLVIGKQRQARVWLNDGAATFVDATGPAPFNPGAPGAAALGDLDGDGDVDALFGDRMLVNDGAGWFAPTALGLPASASAAEDLVLFDLDLDGDLDALFGRVQGTVTLWRNQGGAVFVDASAALPAGAASQAPLSFATGDLDGDGRADVVMGSFGGQNRLWLQDAVGGFVDATAALPVALDATRDVALADLDGDGDLDLWVLNEHAPDVVLRNGGAAAFTAAPVPPGFTGDRAIAVALADFDGDGDVDALRAGIGVGWHSKLAPTPPQLLLNDGTGAFTPSSAVLPSPPRPVTRIAASDMDGDGHLDVVFDGVPGEWPWLLPLQRPFLWLGDGAGRFRDATALVGQAANIWSDWQAHGFAVGDVDEDGDVDVLSAHRVLRNVTRQLSPITYPRIGRPLELLVQGAPGSGFLLCSSLAPARRPLGSLGTLRLDGATFVRRAVGVLDGDGRGRATYDVPLDPALVGTTLYWQALIQHPLGLTNMQSSLLGDR